MAKDDSGHVHAPPSTDEVTDYVRDIAKRLERLSHQLEAYADAQQTDKKGPDEPPPSPAVAQ